MKYRKKPVVIEAFRFGSEDVPDWFLDAVAADNVVIHAEASLMFAEIRTQEGTLRAFPGDWVIRGIQGELYPCKADIFETTYEAAE